MGEDFLHILCSCENCIPNLLAVSSLYICGNPTLRENKSLKPEIALKPKDFWQSIHTHTQNGLKNKDKKKLKAENINLFFEKHTKTID